MFIEEYLMHCSSSVAQSSPGQAASKHWKYMHLVLIRYWACTQYMVCVDCFIATADQPLYLLSHLSQTWVPSNKCSLAGPFHSVVVKMSQFTVLVRCRWLGRGVQAKLLARMSAWAIVVVIGQPVDDTRRRSLDKGHAVTMYKENANCLEFKMKLW